MQRARLQLRHHRAERTDLVREYVGRHLFEQGAPDKVPLNLLALYVSIAGRKLIPKAPRVMLSTFDRAAKPVVAAMESWANKEIEDAGIQGVLERVVTDAFFALGVVKVALASPAESAGAAWGLGAGQPFAARVDLDDFVVDLHAREWGQVGFIGHRYRVPLSAVRDDPHFSKGRKDLSASRDPIFNQEGDERVSAIGRGYYGDAEEYEEHVDLWEVYLPRERLVLTLAEDQLGGAGPGKDKEPLRAVRWLGPDHGPYHVLAFGVVPGNLMPKAPLQDLVDLHRAYNNALRKLIRTAHRMKELTLFQTGADGDADRIRETDDGGMAGVANPDKVKQAVFSGQHIQHLVAVSTLLKDLYSWAAGNLDIMGGLSPQSKTATQDQMLNQNSSAGIADMQERTIALTSGVLKSLCWYWHHDPFRVQASLWSPPGLPEMQVLRRVTPAMRQAGRFEDMNIRVDPYSLQYSSPEKRVGQLNQVVTQIVLPMMQLMVQQGIGFDIAAFLKKIGRYMDMPDLGEVLTIVDAVTHDAGGDKPGMPAQTERKYVRENMPGRTRQGDDQNLISTMLGADPGGDPNKNGQPMGVGA